ncbi:DNA replication and repair protein RecF [Thiomicrorhabdus immobilis]|uniref:DNA replication and repair protein RecF n=1 Tax=Thiomicrorhabdus immobilis TaxID=2791037 RepID=A0ABM7MA67_9GAMM|nr:DNA replication/repair protein RecF [Thiomicrorhabdus immobilis]BCN92219.1 DNA replication and repair protein RecF [Thiomicrorhabdus immobilis]
MTQLTELSIQNFRNCASAQFEFSHGLNLIIGNNAAGKTAIIEAIWLLATGRSFRSQKSHHLIQHNNSSATLFCQTQSSHNANDTHKIGVQKTLDNTLLRIDGETVKSHGPIAKLLPIQLLTPESHKLLEEGPKARRQFMDWGCFHQSDVFMSAWRNYQRGLKQRNHALKKRLPKEQVQLWDQTLVDSALKIDEIRQDYLEALTPYLVTFCQALMPEIESEVVCQYRAGWPKSNEDLLALYQGNFTKDLQLGHTQYGAHRADIRFKFNNQEAMNILSRGQQKLFVCALLLAQASLHEKVVNEPVIMLIDDLPAELDEIHRTKLLELLQILNIQHIITTTSEDLIPVLNPDTYQAWSIQTGKITAK